MLLDLEDTMKVAVVGSGVSGLAATWVGVLLLLTSYAHVFSPTTAQLLNEYTDHEVHLFEADSRPGGHANTVTLNRPGKQPSDVDT